MRFKAAYSKINKHEDKDYYYRSIDEDNLQEADKIAKRYEKKGYRLISLKEDSTWYA